jgi:hypothetical protein
MSAQTLYLAMVVAAFATFFVTLLGVWTVQRLAVEK